MIQQRLEWLLEDLATMVVRVHDWLCYGLGRDLLAGCGAFLLILLAMALIFLCYWVIWLLDTGQILRW